MRLAVRGASRQVAFEVARLAWACGCSLENGTGEHARLPVLAPFRTSRYVRVESVMRSKADTRGLSIEIHNVSVT
jgi:hypothetical protein